MPKRSSKHTSAYLKSWVSLANRLFILSKCTILSHSEVPDEFEWMKSTNNIHLRQFNFILSLPRTLYVRQNCAVHCVVYTYTMWVADRPTRTLWILFKQDFNIFRSLYGTNRLVFVFVFVDVVVVVCCCSIADLVRWLQSQPTAASSALTSLPRIIMVIRTNFCSLLHRI